MASVSCLSTHASARSGTLTFTVSIMASQLRGHCLSARYLFSLARQWMGRPVTGDTSDAVCCKFFHKRLVALHTRPLGGCLMAVQTIGIVVTARVPNGIRVGIGDVIQPVSQSVSFTFQGSGRSVCHVTGVALVLCNPVVPVVPRGQRRAA